MLHVSWREDCKVLLVSLMKKFPKNFLLGQRGWSLSDLDDSKTLCLLFSDLCLSVSLRPLNAMQLLVSVFCYYILL